MISLAEYLILREVATNSGSSVSELLERVNKSAETRFALGTAYGILHSAERAGLVAGTWELPEVGETGRIKRGARPVRKYLITKKGLSKLEKQSAMLAHSGPMVMAHA